MSNKWLDFEKCENCIHNNSDSKECDFCDDYTNFEPLYNADPNCKHDIISASGGGIKCSKCNGWFCY